VRRVVFEATIVVIAFAAAWLLRERGLGAQRADGGTADFDPFLAAAPVLIGVAAALLTIRLYPIPVRALAWSSARRRDLVPALGLRSIGRDPGAAYLPLLVVTLTVAIGVFSSVLALTIDRGQVIASWQETGADYRLETSSAAGFPQVDPSQVPGVEAAAPGFVTLTTTLRDDADRRSPTTFVALDIPAYEAVLAGSPVARAMPVPLTESPTGPSAGAADAPIPVVVSRRLPSGWAPLSVGDTFRIGIRERPVSVTVVGFEDDVPGTPLGVPFVLASLASTAPGWAGPPVHPDLLLVRAPASAEAGLREAYADPWVELASRHATLAAQRAAPLVSAIGAGFGLAVTAAAVYAALAIVAAITLDAQRRSRELAYLRTLGLTSRQSVWLTFVEHAPPTLLALGVGVALGLGVAWLLAPGLGIGAFIGPAAVVRLQVDWLAVASIAAIVLVAIVAMVGASSWLARRLDPGQALRVGDA
jgi:putative ABC transport system permease protein